MDTLKKIIAAFSIFLLISGGWLFFGKKKGNFEAPVPVMVPSDSVRVGAVHKKESFVGRIRSSESVVLSSEVQGRIVYLAEDGSFVKKGEVVVALDDKTAQAASRSAEGMRDEAANRLQNTRKLFKDGFQSQNHLKDTEAKFKQAEGKFLEQNSILEKHKIKAPFDGVLGLQMQSLGASVNQNTQLVSISSLNKLQVEFVVSDSVWQEIGGAEKLAKCEMFAMLEGDSLPVLASFGAHEVIVDSSNDGIRVRAWVDAVSRNIYPGQSADISVDIGKKENVVVVPESALQSSQGAYYVYKVVEGIAVQMPIKIGIKDGSFAEVKEGLKEGDIVVIGGQYRLTDGQPVIIEDNETQNKEQVVNAKQ